MLVVSFFIYFFTFNQVAYCLAYYEVFCTVVCFFCGACDVLPLVTAIFPLLPFDGAVLTCVLFFK